MTIAILIKRYLCALLEFSDVDYPLIYSSLQVVENAVFINKGTNPDIDSYSAFWDNNKLSQTGLINELTSRGITDVYVCGLAYDICVGKYPASVECFIHEKMASARPSRITLG